ncbi:hypothetical protein AB0H42_17745 [Nocardia sp. NPDC050799]|uniref:hypothetical protein n=1 Tax=Nocardia sp. NPDC050799 TaxID=3154842 RepID=UPI00340FDAC9
MTGSAASRIRSAAAENPGSSWAKSGFASRALGELGPRELIGGQRFAMVAQVLIQLRPGAGKVVNRW